MEYGRCQNGLEDFKMEMEDNLSYQFHTTFTEKQRRMSGSDKLNNIVAKVFYFNIYAYY